MLKTTAGRRIPENERRKDDIRQMGDHRLKELVLRCIEDESDERLNAKEVVDWLQKVKMSKLERKTTIALKRGLNQLPILKIITLGESATGKTCIIRRFAENRFDNTVQGTIGIDICVRNVSVYGREFQLTVFDTAGQERFSSLASYYLRHAVGVLLVFDVTNKRSFEESIPNMLELIHPGDGIRAILVGNKVDAEGRVVTRKEAETLAAFCGVPYFETSAVTGQNIQKVFEEITKVIYITSELTDSSTNPTVKDALVLNGSQKETTSSWWRWLC